MLHFERWKIIAIILTCLTGLLFAIPNFVSKETLQNWPDFLPKRQMPLGLDLRGGAHLLLAMDQNEIRKDWLQGLQDDARRTLREAKIGFSGIGIQDNSVRVTLVKPEDGDRAFSELKKISQSIGNALLGTAGMDVDVTRSGDNQFVIKPTEQGFNERLSHAASASIETINRRVNALGTAESTIVRQGLDRILVQYPGLSDTRQLKELIGQTAKLSFHAVHPTVSPEEARATRVPLGYKIYESMERAEAGGQGEYVLQESAVVLGEDLEDAQPGFDQRTNEPIISFRFNTSGARKFGNFTKNNVGRPFAIVLDDKVISAPVIREAILGGSGQISGNFTVESANNLAIQLRSGALPAKLTVVEERTVGPSLGADSIEFRQDRRYRWSCCYGHHDDRRVWNLWRLCRHRTHGSRPSHSCVDVGNRHDADASRHRGLRAHHRHGSGRKRAHLRAHSRRTSRRQDGNCRDRRGIPEGLHHDPGQPADDARCRSHHVLARLRAHPRLRGYAVARHHDLGLRRYHHYPPARRDVAEECQVVQDAHAAGSDLTRTITCFWFPTSRVSTSSHTARD